MSYPPQQQPKHSMSNGRALAIVGAVLAVICGSLACLGYLGYLARENERERPSAGSSSPSATLTKAAPVGTKYATAADVMKAMNTKGLQCDGYKTIPIELYDDRALQSAFCKTSDGTELNVSIYTSSADAKTSVQRLYDKPAQSSYGSVGTYGENWAVHVSYDKRGWIKDVSRALGGSTIEIPPAK